MNRLDSFERVTEYESAADHTLTLKKFQELHIPMSAPIEKGINIVGSKRAQQHRSVFEEDSDYIDPRNLKPGEEAKRWKFKGPWITGQTEFEFTEYLKKDVRGRKDGFHQYLREEYVRQYNVEVNKSARDSEDGPVHITLADVTEDQLNAYVRQLRSLENRSTLFRLVRQFLDLAPAAKADEYAKGLQKNTDEYSKTLAPASTASKDSETAEKDMGGQNPYAVSGPPKTHPSAGLSYLRDLCYIENHPIHGPQQDRRPVPARVILPQEGLGGKDPKLGVAGVVIDTPIHATGFNHSNLGTKRANFASDEFFIPGLKSIEPNKVGGSKVWLKIDHANITPQGRINLSTSKASEMSVRVATGVAGTADDVEAAPALMFPARQRPEPFARPQIRRTLSEPSGFLANLYGLGKDRREEVPREEKEPSQEDSTQMLQRLLNKSKSQNDEDRW